VIFDIRKVHCQINYIYFVIIYFKHRDQVISPLQTDGTALFGASVFLAAGLCSAV